MVRKKADPRAPVFPFSAIVGQEESKQALRIVHVDPGIGGVLLSGDRGTGKSTVVRAFAAMTDEGRLPTTIPINATEDRVVGGYRLDALMQSRAERQEGLIEEAADSILYVDEVNLLEDHIVNILLDVVATGVLHIERDDVTDQKNLRVVLVGTMNPEEGVLRPQLEDRFALMIQVQTEGADRVEILKSSLAYDIAREKARSSQQSPWMDEMRDKDAKELANLVAAKERLEGVVYQNLFGPAAALAEAFKTQGSRAERVLVRAGRALAAINSRKEAGLDHLTYAAPLVLVHRQKALAQRSWGEAHRELVRETLEEAQRTMPKQGA